MACCLLHLMVLFYQQRTGNGTTLMAVCVEFKNCANSELSFSVYHDFSLRKRYQETKMAPEGLLQLSGATLCACVPWRRCRRRIRAADSGPSYPFRHCCGCGLPRLFSLPPGLALFNSPVPCYNRKKRNRVIFWNFMVPLVPPVPSRRPCSAWWKLA